MDEMNICHFRIKEKDLIEFNSNSAILLELVDLDFNKSSNNYIEQEQSNGSHVKLNVTNLHRKGLLKKLFKNLISMENYGEKNLRKIIKNCIPCQTNLGLFKLNILLEKNMMYNMFRVFLKINNNSKQMDVFLQDCIETFKKEEKLKFYKSNELNFKRKVHEFKIPLNSVIGLCTQLAGTQSKIPHSSSLSPINPLIKQIVNISTYTQFLIKDIMSFSKHNSTCLDRGSTVLNLEKVKIKDILDFSFQILNSLLLCDEKKSKFIKTYFYTSGKSSIDNLYIYTDEIRLKQILLNFLSNSVKFTHQGSITLKSKICERNEQMVKVTVEDTGVGIKKEDKKKLFKQFSKLTNENNDFVTGLGLNISKCVADLMNIKIKVKSQEKVGTKMLLYIPLCNSDSDPYHINDLENSNIEDNIEGYIDSNDDQDNNHNDSNIILISRHSINSNPKKTNNKAFALQTIKLNPFATKDINQSFERDSARSKTSQEKNKIEIQKYIFDQTLKDSILNSSSSSNASSNSNLNTLKDTLINFHIPTFNYEMSSPRIKDLTFSIITHNHTHIHNNINNDFNINLGSCMSTVKSDKEKIIVIYDQIFPRGFLVYSIKEVLSIESKNDAVGIVVNNDPSSKYEILEGNDGIDCLKYIIGHQNLVKVVFIDENMTFING